MRTDLALKLLDGRALQPVLGAIPSLAGREPESMELASLWVKPGRHFNTHWSVAYAGGERIGVSAFLADPAHVKRALRDAGDHTCTPGAHAACARCATAAAGDVLLQVFPHDYRLPALARCLDVDALARLIPHLEIAAAAPRAYRPGMRCQIEYRTVSGRRLFGKVSVETRGAGYGFHTHERLYTALTSGARTVAVAEPVTYVASLGLALVAAEDGESLYDLVRRGAEPVDGARQAAVALAALHELGTLVPERAYAAGEEIALVSSWAELTAALFPGLAGPLGDCASALAAARPAAGAANVLVHRDFYDKQVLVRDGRPPVVLDMDTVAVGDPEIDVANFRAHTVLRRYQYGSAALHRKLEDAFVVAYPRRLDGEKVEWYRRAALLRLACGYALRPRWRHVAPQLIAAARGED